MVERVIDRGAYLRRSIDLSLSVLPVPHLPITAAAPTHHDGVMVALVPADPEPLAIDHPEALPADDLHVTLCYFGKVQDLSNADKVKILTTTQAICNDIGKSFSTSADGVVVMGENDDGVPATALLVQSDEIVNLYNALSDALGYQSKFPSFIPHMTTGYGVPIESAQALVGDEIYFDKVIVKFGEQVQEVPLSRPMVAAPEPTANVLDRVVDSLGRTWDEAHHPRDGKGKFIKKSGAVSGKLHVVGPDGKSVNLVDVNRADVVGFHTFDNEIWVLAEFEDENGEKARGFAKTSAVQAKAPVKARLDALYPVDDEAPTLGSILERLRQLDLILAHAYTLDADSVEEFIESLGLNKDDLAYIFPEDADDNGSATRQIPMRLSADERKEQIELIRDAQAIKELRDRIALYRKHEDVLE